MLEDKTVISTDVQTAGRGRFTRSWVDLGADNIYMTIILKPSSTLSSVHANLTQYLSVVLSKQLESMGLFPEIKWPNDVLLGGKKVCGILAEAVIKGGVLKGIVLGIGVNLNATEDNLSKIDRPATSVNLETGKSVDKQEFLHILIDNFFSGYDDFLSSGFPSVKEYYTKKSPFLEKNLKIAIFNSIKEGYSKGFGDDGSLVLLLPNGEVENINMGEIV